MCYCFPPFCYEFEVLIPNSTIVALTLLTSKDGKCHILFLAVEKIHKTSLLTSEVKCLFCFVVTGYMKVKL